MSIRTVTSQHAVCPHCDATGGSIDHLLPMHPGLLAGPWYCDTCGGAYSIRVTAIGAVTVEKSPGRKIETRDVLILPPQDKPVYFVVSGMRFEGAPWQRPDDDPKEQKRYFYEEHSCPVNWLKPEVVWYDGDSDPHGVIEYVATVDVAAIPPEEDVTPNEHNDALVEIIQRHAAQDPGVAPEDDQP
jgi:hypothetical protein